VTLRNLPAKVTTARENQTIPGYQNWVDVPVVAAPDAPPGTVRSVFAYGYFRGGGGAALNSDMFTVTVQAGTP